MVINKRGQGLSTTTMILLILGIAVLVILILGFTGAFDKIAPFLSKDNAGSISQACDIACSTSAVYSFCSSPRELKADVTLDDVTCNYLAQKEGEYGIADCPNIQCSTITLVDLPAGESLEDQCLGNEGTTVQALVNNKLESFDC